MDIFTKGPMYPILKSEYIKNPSRFYAVPFLGIFVKVIMLIPVGIELMALSFAYLVVTLINSFYVLFTGVYWNTAYELTLGLLRMYTKVWFFLAGLTNKYPGFDLSINDTFSVDMEKPKNPNRLFAIPLIGGIARIILLIPFFFWENLVQYAAQIGVFVSFVPVLFNGRYPQSTQEIAVDHQRLSLTVGVYMAGLTDSYPNFTISMKHKEIKIVLLVIGALWMLSSWMGNVNTWRNPRPVNYGSPYRMNHQPFVPTANPYQYNNGSPMNRYPPPPPRTY